VDMAASSGRHQPPPGWYPDNARPDLLRYWDGNAWTAQVMPRAQPPRQPPATKRKGSKVSWLALGGFVIGLFAVIGACHNGQALKSVDLKGGKIEYYSSTVGKDISKGTIEDNQSQVEQRLQELESSAQAAPNEDDALARDLTGNWTDTSGRAYRIDQYGAEGVIQEQSPYGVTAVGSGTVHRNRFSFEFQAVDGSSGVGELNILDQNTLRGTFTNFFTGEVNEELHR
jgi:hypothetical protein